MTPDHGMKTTAASMGACSPRSALGVLALALCLGVLAPALLAPTFPHDLVEGFLWGRSFEWGYYKHPPLQAWLLGALERLVSDDWRRLAFLYAQACVGIAILSVWRLASSIAGPAIGAFAAVVTLAGLNPYTTQTQTFTPDTLTLPLWALSLLFYWRAVGEGRSGSWYGLMLCGVGFVYAKYTGIVLFGVLFVLTLATPEGRRALRAKEPWICMALGALLVAPHLLWLSENPGPLSYPLGDVMRARADGLGQRLLFPAKFLVAQAMNHIGLAVLLGLCMARAAYGGATLQARPPAQPVFARRFLAAVALAPLAFVLGLNFWAEVEFRHAWASPFFPASALAFLVLSRARLRLDRMPMVLGCAAMAVVIQHLAPPATAYFNPKGFQTTLPSKDMANEMSERFRSATGRPLRIVAGDRWNAGQIAFYSPDRPLFFIDGNPDISPWITQPMVRRDGVLAIWPDERDATAPGQIVGQFAGLPEEGRVQGAHRNWTGGPMVTFLYAIVPPEGDAR